MIFDQLQKGFGSVPNLYATREYPEHALGNYLALQNGKSSLNGKAREVINLVVSEVNRCQYWLAVRTMIGKKTDLTDEQILEIRSGKANFDAKLDALARLVHDMAVNRGHAADASVAHSLRPGGPRPASSTPSS
ncbi:carboxymuconolactone decarboxylase family protein [Paraburkholderia sp. SARCC-3016]|uniref:carboxymuconolactone decarboxylase family protein n=1 Tax=Paraburkholderia sp. SARCC-3016 TaxID=3058611 RepID=UPI002808C2DB|nr:carboxymuconolactone decarboxylase family protein [Paraburkholderia sp. SARCC-3016]MDQ7982291.1 carboxymuconolactone decarboxylase family protein [Paraburkholderia sp. SARCC-3016]